MDLANYLSFLGAAILLTLAYASCHGRCGGFHPELAGIFHGLEILRRGLPPLSLLRRFPREGRFDQGGRRGG